VPGCTCNDVAGSTKTTLNSVESQCSDEAATATHHSLFVVCSGEFATSCSRDWPSQQQLIDVSSIIVSLISSI